MPDPLALLDAEVSRLEAELVRARDARDLLARLSGKTPPAPRPPVEEPAPRAVEETPRGKRDPRPRAEGSGRKPGPPPDPEVPRRVIAALAGGPMRFRDLERLEITSHVTLSKVLHGSPDLFRQVDPANRLSPWELTAEGRAEAERATAAA